MARKKQILKSGYDSNLSLIGISCHLKSYRLSFSMNKALKFAFRRIDDFEIPGNPGNQGLNYPFLIYDNTDLKNHFCLISNHHPSRKLVPALRQVDYFLMANNPLESNTIASILTRIRNINQVVAAYEIDANGTKDLDVLLEEMELHLLISQKNLKDARA